MRLLRNSRPLRGLVKVLAIIAALAFLAPARLFSGQWAAGLILEAGTATLCIMGILICHHFSE